MTDSAEPVKTPPPVVFAGLLGKLASNPAAAGPRRLWTFLGAVLLLRCLVLAALPLDLSGDEAYYWDWGRNLDWGYFSKPPGIAWLMALAGKLGGDTTFGVRLFAALLGSGALAMVTLLAWRLYGFAAAMAAGLVFAATPASAALSLILTIDAPLAFFWAASLYLFWRLAESDSSSPAWAAALCLALSCGVLAKQMMLLFHPLAVLHLALSKGQRGQLRRPALWIALALSLAALLPTLWWNHNNGWITYKHTLHHFEGGGVSPLQQVGRWFEFVGSQLGIITPVLWVLMLALAVGMALQWGKLADRERFLWIFGAPGLLVVLLMGFRQRLNPNWPAVFYLSMLVMMAGWAAGAWRLDGWLESWRRAFLPGVRLALGLCVATHLAVLALSMGLLKLPGLDPTIRVRGWSRMAADIHKARMAAPEGASLPVITQSHRYIASALAFYLPGQPRVYIYNPDPGAIRSQYDLWPGPAAHVGKDAWLVIQGGPEEIQAGLTNLFESVAVESVFRYPGQSSGLRVVTLALGKNLRRWPSLDDTRN